MIPFGPWTPDQPDFNNPGVTIAKNCVPAATGYKAFRDFGALTAAADAWIRGIGTAKGSDDSINFFAGDGTKLYKFDASDSGLDNVSKSGNYSLGAEDVWNFVQFGDRVIASHGHDDILQSYVIGTSSLFADLASTPAAEYLAVVKDQVVAANVKYSSTVHPRRLYWSALDDPTGWTIGTSQSDIQDISDLGNITGIVGGEIGSVFLERGIVRMSYVGSPLIFQFDKVETSRGCPYSGSIANVGPISFYLSQDGFYTFDGNRSTPIGNERVNRFFFDSFARNAEYRISAQADPSNQVIVWSYPSGQSQDGTPDRLLFYNYVLDKWSFAEVTTERLGTIISPGYTLEQLANISSSIEDLPGSLDDSLFVGGEYLLAAGKDKKIGMFNGSRLEAIIETQELEISPGKSSLVTQVQPYVDFFNVGTTPTVTAAIQSRNRHIDSADFSTASSVNADNFIPVRSSGRFHKLKFTISDFDIAQGFDVTIQERGLR